MADETLDARMERLLRTLPPALRGMGFGDPDDAEYAHASDVVSWAIREIDRLREERRRREALWRMCADETRLVYGGVFRPQPLPEAAP